MQKFDNIKTESEQRNINVLLNISPIEKTLKHFSVYKNVYLLNTKELEIYWTSLYLLNEVEILRNIKTKVNYVEKIHEKQKLFENK